MEQKCTISEWRRQNLINSSRYLGQVLVDTGHRELDLVTETLLWTFSSVCSRDPEEQDAEQ